MRNRNRSIFANIIVDLLAVGVVLCVFATFHHVIPAYESKKRIAEAKQNPVAAVSAQPVSEPQVTPEPQPEETVLEKPEETVLEKPEETDDRTEWQKKFADKFTDEVVITDHSYTSPNVSVSVTKVETEITGYGYGYWPCTYYVADVYVGSIECFRTYTANNRMDRYGTQAIADMDLASNALISISGDFFGYQSRGFIVRNSEVFIDNSSGNSACVLFDDGTIETYKGGDYDVQELMQRGVRQVWSFGPVLLENDGKAVSNPRSSAAAVNQQNPRSAIGYYEPGHYCYVLVDGRTQTSKGMILQMLADVFEELGCTRAYNLDGGGSAMMLFNHQLISSPSNGDRFLSDILCVVEPESVVPGPMID